MTHDEQTAFADQVDDEARQWIKDWYPDWEGGVFSFANMVTAYRSGFAGGLRNAREAFEAKPAVALHPTQQPPHAGETP